jgi:hypothetical protein
MCKLNSTNPISKLARIEGKNTKYFKEIQNVMVYIIYTNNTNNYTIFKNRLGRTFLVPNTSISLQTTLAAAAHLEEGQFYLKNKH